MCADGANGAVSGGEGDEYPTVSERLATFDTFGGGIEFAIVEFDEAEDQLIGFADIVLEDVDDELMSIGLLLMSERSQRIGELFR